MQTITNNIQFRSVYPDKVINPQQMGNCYRNGKTLFRNFTNSIPFTLKTAGDEFGQLYLSINEDNFKIRNKILHSKAFKKISHNSAENTKERFQEVNKLFTKLDNDKNAKSFLSKLPITSIDNISIKTLNDILERISTLKLKIFATNASAILANTEESSVVKTLENELENPFYETKMQKYWQKSYKAGGYKSTEPLILVIFKKLCNYVNILRYKYQSMHSNAVK